MEKYRYIVNNINKANKGLAVLTAGYFRKDILIALSEQEKEHVMNEKKFYLNLNERAVGKNIDHPFDLELPKKVSPPGRRTEMVAPNPAMSNDPNKVVFLKHYSPSHPPIEKSVPSREEREESQFGPSKTTPFTSNKEKGQVIKSLERSAAGVLGAENPDPPENQLEALLHHDRPRIFADDHARFAWEIGQAVDRAVATLPPEDRELKFQRITFSSKHRSKGIHAVFYTGTVIGTDQKNVLLVPERTLKVLDALDVKYRVVQAK